MGSEDSPLADVAKKQIGVRAGHNGEGTKSFCYGFTREENSIITANF